MNHSRGRLLPLLWAVITAGTACTGDDGVEADGTAAVTPMGQLPSAGTPAAGIPGATAGDTSMAPPMGGAAGATAGMVSGGTSGVGAAGEAAQPSDGKRDVLLVGNSVSGTVSFIDAVTFESLGSVNVTPDMDEVLALIQADIGRAIGYPSVKNSQLLHHFEPGGGDRFVDDVFVSPGGDVLYVSRSNLGDVAAFDLTQAGHPRLWRTFVSGVKADHAAISPDGSKLVVSATSIRRAEVFDAATGAKIDSFATGSIPHQNDYSADGKHIYNSSIGNVGYNAVSHANNAQKGDRWLVKVDAETLEVVDTWVFEWGIRPNVISADETILYTQLSYLNGLIKYDLTNSVELQRSDQPLSEFALQTYANYDEYPHDSAHHGLALSGDGTRLCDCGTIDNNVAIVAADDLSVVRTIDVGMVPYWATTSPDGRYCFVSLSGSDAISVIDYETAEEIQTIPVGQFPQRSRLGRVPEELLALLVPSAG